MCSVKSILITVTLMPILAIAIENSRDAKQAGEPSPSVSVTPKPIARKATSLRPLPLQSSDRQITRQIRRDLLSQESISPYARDIKVITVDGKVMVKGSVRSENDEKIILRLARNVAGRENVLNRLEIVPLRRAE